MTDYPDEVAVAFTGRQVERVVESRSDNGVRSVFEVERVYKGEAGPTLEVWTAFDGSMCGVDPGPGQVHVAAGVWNDQLSMGLCGSIVSKDDLVSTFGTGQLPDQALAAPVSGDGGGTGLFVLIAGGSGIALVAIGLALWSSGKNETS